MRRIALLAVILLSGCSLLPNTEADFSCPKTGFIDKAANVTYFMPGTKDVAVEAAIRGFNGDCSFNGPEGKEVEVALTLPFGARREAAAGDVKKQELPYFVAVLSPEEEILQRQSFTTTIDFDNTGTGSSTEEHVIKIPLQARSDAHKYKVVIGFALTHDQLKYNEGHK